MQCPFQVYGSQSSSYWYPFISFQVLGTCLIATGTAPEHHFTLDLEGILDPIALHSGSLASSKTVLLLQWECHLAPSAVPWPAQMVPKTIRKWVRFAKCHSRAPEGLHNGAQSVQNVDEADKKQPVSQPASSQESGAGGRGRSP